MGDILLRVIYLCTIGCCIYTSGWLLVKAGRNKTTWALAACQVLVIIWCVPLLFNGFLTTKGAKYLAYGISYVGISLIGPAWLEFSFRYCGKMISRRMRKVLFGLPLLHYAIFLSNESHHLFYRQFTVERVVYGPIFYVHMAYTYVCVLTGLAVVIREFKKKKVAAVHLTLILLTAAVPLGFNMLYISRVIHSTFDLTPPAFAWSSFLMLLAVFRYDFLDINSMAFEQIFSSIAEGVIVYNRNGKLTYCNEAARRWLGLGRREDGGTGNGIDCGRSAEASMGRGCGTGNGIESGTDYDVVRERLNVWGAGLKGLAADGISRTVQELSPGDGTRLRLKQYIYRDGRGQMTAGILILTDVSEYYELLRQSQELEISGRRLAVEQERNRIAQEVHDTTGHTLTMIQSLLRLIRMEFKKETEGSRQSQEVCQGDRWDEENGHGSGQALEYLDQAQELVSGGIRELRCAINQMRQTRDMTVTQSVVQLAESVKEITVETEIRGEDGPAYTALSSVVYKILREAITNCLKYAGASRMDVIVKFETEYLSLYIFDDGQGCEEIRENNGIRGIRERTQQAGGTVRVMSAAGEGFQIYVKLPVENHTEPVG